jgi:hypothetical protein
VGVHRDGEIVERLIGERPDFDHARVVDQDVDRSEALFGRSVAVSTECCERPQSVTFAPASSSSRARMKPNPRDPPVMTADLPAKNAASARSARERRRAASDAESAAALSARTVVRASEAMNSGYHTALDSIARHEIAAMAEARTRMRV